MDVPFWMVYGDGAGEPSFRHHAFESAKKEAERLAAKNPDRRFYVLQAVGFSLSIKPVSWTAFNKPEIPTGYLSPF